MARTGRKISINRSDTSWRRTQSQKDSVTTYVFGNLERSSSRFTLLAGGHNCLPPSDCGFALDP